MMDKHQRKHIAKWEAKKAKDARKVEEDIKRHSYERALEHIAQVVGEWEPCPKEVFTNARNFLKERLFQTARNTIIDDHRFLFFINQYHLMYSKRWRFSMSDMEIAAEIAEQKSQKREAQALQLAWKLSRYQSRINAFREELLQKTARLRTIQDCLLVKEELMMNVWHPRRMEHILETYGWEAYENLLGVE